MKYRQSSEILVDTLIDGFGTGEGKSKMWRVQEKKVKNLRGVEPLRLRSLARGLFLTNQAILL